MIIMMVVFKRLPSEHLQVVIFFSNHFSSFLVSDNEIGIEECPLLQVRQIKAVPHSCLPLKYYNLGGAGRV